MSDLSQQAQIAVEAAKKSGAQDAFATISESRDVEFSYRDGKLEQVKDATSLELSIKLYVDGRYSAHSSTDLRLDSVSAFIREAVAITRALQQDKFRLITPPELYAGRTQKDLELLDASVLQLDRDQRLAWCKELDELVHGDERLISATSAVYDGNARSASASSNGFSASESSTYLWLGSELTFRDRGDRRASSDMFVGSTQRGSLPATKDIAKTALDKVRARLGANKGPTVKTSMLVDASVAGGLLGRLLSSANGRELQQGRSFWGGLQGSKAFSDKLTIIDNPLLVRGMNSRHYDSEGISAKPVALVENGIARNLYIDTYYGRKLGMTPTTGSASNRIVQPGTQSLGELLSGMGKGIYVTSWLGGNADGTTGEFSLGLRGHLVENGKIGAPVDEMNVTGNLVDLFARLVAIGNDPWIYTTTISPSLLFEGVDFSGA